MADGNLGFGNPYLQPAIDAALGDTVRSFNLTAQPAFNSAMVRSGSFGNSGVQQMNDEAQRQLQTSLGRQANDMRYGDYWNNQQFGRQLYNDAFGMQQQNFQNGLNLLGLGNQAATQNLGLGTSIQNTPMNYFNNFAQQANSLGQGYGTSTGTMSAQGSPLMGALGGYQIGSQFGKNMGGSDWSSNWGAAMRNNGQPGFDSPYG